MTGDGMALIWSFLYVGAVVTIGEVGHRLGLPKESARKIIHVGVGFWIFGTVTLFTSPWMAAIAPLTSAVGNWVIHKKRLLRAVEAPPDNLGTVWYPIAFALLVLLAWDRPIAMVGGVMAMTIGDALASTIGQRWGRLTYRTLGGAIKSVEGSLAMFCGTAIALLGVMAWFFYPAVLWHLDLHVLGAALGLVVLAAVVATGAEALGIKGRDNLWVPLSTGAVLYFAFMDGVTAKMLFALGLGAVLAAEIGLLAWLKRSLTPSGVLGAILTGTLVFGLGGWAGGVPLVGFFLSSSMLSRLFRARKAAVESEYAKSGARDLGQALANGGVAAVAALLMAGTGDQRYLGALLGALAAANADTWATEIGVLARSAPRLITTFRPVPVGSSGAVSVVGTLAALGGAALVALLAALVDPHLWRVVPWIALAGLSGALLDSLLGATVQGIYYCASCQKETERQVHGCGVATVRRRGWSWLGNDLVNLLATVAGAAIGFWVF